MEIVKMIAASVGCAAATWTLLPIVLLQWLVGTQEQAPLSRGEEEFVFMVSFGAGVVAACVVIVAW